MFKCSKGSQQWGQPTWAEAFEAESKYALPGLPSGFLAVVLLCFPGTKSVTIPDFIEVIAPHSFEQCNQLQKVEIPSNSNLQMIGEKAFEYSIAFSRFALNSGFMSRLEINSRAFSLDWLAKSSSR